MTYPYEFALFAERNRNLAYDEVIGALEKAAVRDGVTQAKIADAMGRKRPQVSAWLSGPSNWTLDTISDLLRAVGATMEYKAVFDSERAASNIFHPALAEDSAHTKPSGPTSFSAVTANKSNGFIVQLEANPSPTAYGASPIYSRSVGAFK
jgi:transcriptional regulator with XRE-family HTH domain